ncbi:MAG TPA: hypothetical protein PLG15_00295 [Candidatus Gastranaerophilaceae bacterium]|nr:hypothetical protein [Candidatus Gastranaerophilaceae bacterium]HPT40806.1 hypothetical protein [Candidatus Gastranaerophilaceae bacterium]
MNVNSIKNYDFKNHTNISLNAPLKNGASKSKISFKGGEYNLANMMGLIEGLGFFGAFFIIDSLSLITPRIVVGLNRDKDKLGHLNYKAGAEEAGREVLSGPSMFLIPIGIFEVVRRTAAASKIPKNTMKVLFEHTKQTLKGLGDTSLLSNKKEFSEKFAQQLFDKAFGEFDLGDKAAQFKKRFTTRLVWCANSTSDKKSFKKNMAAFEKIISEINNSNRSKTPIHPKIIDIGDNVKVRAKDLFEDFRHYSSDIITKISKRKWIDDASKSLKKEAVNWTDNMKKIRLSLRFGACVASFFAVGAFLIHLPKLYQVSKDSSPAEESAKRASLEKSKGGTNAS